MHFYILLGIICICNFRWNLSQWFKIYNQRPILSLHFALLCVVMLLCLGFKIGPSSGLGSSLSLGNSIVFAVLTWPPQMGGRKGDIFCPPASPESWDFMTLKGSFVSPWDWSLGYANGLTRTMGTATGGDSGVSFDIITHLGKRKMFHQCNIAMIVTPLCSKPKQKWKGEVKKIISTTPSRFISWEKD